MPHAVHVAHCAEHHAPGHRSSHIELGGFFQAVICKSPCNSRWLCGRIYAGAAPYAGAGCVNGVVGIERVYLHIAHPSGASVISAAKTGIYCAVIIIICKRSGVPSVTNITDDTPCAAAVCCAEYLIPRAPPVHGSNNDMLRVLSVNAYSAVSARTPGRPGSRRHVCPGKRGCVQPPDLTCRYPVGAVSPAGICYP